MVFLHNWFCLLVFAYISILLFFLWFSNLFQSFPISSFRPEYLELVDLGIEKKGKEWKIKEREEKEKNGQEDDGWWWKMSGDEWEEKKGKKAYMTSYETIWHYMPIYDHITYRNIPKQTTSYIWRRWAVRGPNFPLFCWGTLGISWTALASFLNGVGLLWPAQRVWWCFFIFGLALYSFHSFVLSVVFHGFPVSSFRPEIPGARNRKERKRMERKEKEKNGQEDEWGWVRGKERKEIIWHYMIWYDHIWPYNIPKQTTSYNINLNIHQQHQQQQQQLLLLLLQYCLFCIVLSYPYMLGHIHTCPSESTRSFSLMVLGI